jgi:hypothetical protein
LPIDLQYRAVLDSNLSDMHAEHAAVHCAGGRPAGARVAPILPVVERDDLVDRLPPRPRLRPSLVQTGLHPLDGARHLRTLGHERLAGIERCILYIEARMPSSAAP